MSTKKAPSKSSYAPLQKQNTDTGDDSAARLWAIFRKEKGLPPVPTREELEGSGAETAVLELSIFALARPIPIHFDDNLQPTTNTNRCCTATTLVGYLGKYIKLFRGIYPEHPDWKDLKKPDDVPQWWTEMRKTVFSRATDNQIKWQGSYEFGVGSVRALYLDLGALEGENPLKFCDLKHIIIALVKNAHPSNKNIEMAAKIMMTYDSIARGGEIKFQKFTDWSFDYMTYVLDTQWKEAKTCDAYAMARVSDKRWWFDFFFIMGAHAMCNKGLYRSEEEIKNGFMHTVFPDLQKYSDNYVTTLVGNAVKAGLQGTVPDYIIKMFSAKSCRIGAINTLALNALMTAFSVCARSGHSVGEGVNALPSYLDRMNVLHGLPAALALHGYKSVHAKKVVYPQVSAVGSFNMESMGRLIEKMFLITIPQFQENGELREVVHMFAASLILHYKQLNRDCGPTNQIASKLEWCAEQAKITYAGRPQLSPIDVLVQYSVDIKKKFDEDTKISEAGDEAATKRSIELEQLVEISSDVKEIKASERDLAQDLIVARQALDAANQENARLKEELKQSYEMLSRANDKLQFLQSNSSPVRPKRPRDEDAANDQNEIDQHPAKRQHVQGVVSNDNADLFEAMASCDDDFEDSKLPAKPLPPKPKGIRNTNKSESFNSRTGDGGLLLVDALTSLSEFDLFHSGKRLDSITIPPTICENRDKLQHCLTLIDFAGNQSDIDDLSKDRRMFVNLHDTVTRLVNAARDKLFEFEDTTYENALRKGNVPGLSVLGMAKRVVTYRNKIKEDLGLGKKLQVSKVQLMEPRELLQKKKEKEAPANPTGLDKFLRRSSTNSSE